MMDIFGFLAQPLGWLMWLVYEYIGFHNYFLTIFLFTFLIRFLMFPLSLKNQKSTMERAKLAPRLERLQKKYGNDRQKLQQKQQEIYEKEGVSLTGGCFPMLIQMIVLFGIVAVIYSPLTFLVRMDSRVVDAAVAGVRMEKDADGNEIAADGKISEKDLTGYYTEMRMLNALENNREDVLKNIQAIDDGKAYDEAAAEEQYTQLIEVREEFMFFGHSLLENPWRGGFGDISLLWLIPLLSGASAMLSSWLSMHYTKGSTSPEMQQAQGCSNGMMYGMPLFSLFITFTVPGGVGIYWICSNLVSLLQTVILNKMYNPAKARAEAEAEYQERRRRKAEDKKRLAEARQRELEADTAGEDKTAEPSADDAGKSSEKPSKEK